MLAVRYSDDINYDIERNWSAWQDEVSCMFSTDLRYVISQIWWNLSVSDKFDSCEDYMSQFSDDDELAYEINKHLVNPMCEGLHRDPRSGAWLMKHHDGLSVYLVDAETIEEAIEEAKNSAAMDGSGYGVATVGTIAVLKTVPAAEANSLRDLHILEIEDYKTEQ